MAENHRNHENDELGRLDASDAKDRKILLTVLLINLTQSAAGIALGIWAGSTALMGAGLDNLADASVYAVSLYAVGRAATVKVGAARLSGFLLIGLAALLLLEVLRRFAGGEEPVGPAMMAMAALNAALNLVCLRLLRRHRGGFYPEITDCLERTENFWSCLTRRRRILGLWRRSIYSNTSDRAASSVGYVVR